MIKRNKDLTNCLSQQKFPIFRWASRFYKGFLWRDHDSMINNVILDDGGSDCRAVCTHASYVMMFPEDGPNIIKAPRYLGELHFVKRDWNLEVVSHECTHALLNICRAMNIHPFLEIHYEEQAAYKLGVLVDNVYTWLWSIDPPRVSLRQSIKRWLQSWR